MISDIVVSKLLYEHICKVTMRPNEFHNMIRYAFRWRLSDVDCNPFCASNIEVRDNMKDYLSMHIAKLMLFF